MPITDLFSRFKAWGHDSRASSRSLDYTLRKASRLHEQVLELLAPFKIEIQSGRSASIGLRARYLPLESP